MKNLLALFLVWNASTAFAAVKLSPLITEGLDSPVAIASAPGESERLYLVEQRGKIWIFENGRVNPIPFLDIEEKVVSGGEMGLLSIAFHPNYRANKRFFVNYTAERPKLTTVVAEYQAGKNDEREILTFRQPYQNHNGGQLAFDAKGYLYIATGDGGSGGDPQGNSQNRTNLLGKILRIDIDRGEPYAIPTDNPFKGAAMRGEIFAYGLRNPWRFSFDRLTGALFAADVGQDKWEEINVVEKGGNYGWNTMEGKHCFKPPQNCNQEGLILPIWEYAHSQGNSITGGYVYRGKRISELYGVYLYADYGSGKVWGLTYDQNAKKVIKNEVLVNSHFPISTFGEDADGEIYVGSYTGAIYKLVLK